MNENLPVSSDQPPSSGDLTPFESAWWCPSPHIQTIWRGLFGITPSLPIERVRWDTPDGDFIDLDFLNVDPLHSKTPIILLLHGLEGSSRSKYILGLLKECHQKKWFGIAMNFRSCSGEINRLIRSYHSGETGDLNWVIARIIQQYPGHPICIAGYSLGGNVLLKWLGENGNQAPPPVAAAAAVSVPFDLKISVSLIDAPGFNRTVYAAALLRTLKEKFLRKIKRFDLNISYAAVLKINTFHEFDNLVTAPVHGFRDAEDYWFQSSSIRYLDNIQKPVYLLSAKDDPLLSEDVFSFNQVKENRFIKKEVTQKGGHVGFVSGQWPWNASYLPDSRIVNFFNQMIEKERKTHVLT